MPSFNRVILIGNLTAKPELRFSEAGNPWTKFTLAVNDHYKDAKGEVVNPVHFFDVTAFGRQAETLTRFLDKGSPLLVEGRLSQSRWEDDEGKKRTKVEVILRRFQFISGGIHRDAPDHEEMPLDAMDEV